MSPIDLLAEAAARVTPRLPEVLDLLAAPRPEDGVDGAHRVAPRLAEAMRYALTSPGKRLRPALVLGGAHAVGAPLDDALPPACAVEMIHAYSLVHDDLPDLDDDDERRGQPSTHRKFDVATALLAGDALLTEALGLVADGPALGAGRRVPAEARALAAVELARASGAAGMVGGQQDDIELEMADNPHGSAAAVRSIHQRKTGRLIQASVALGGLYGGGSAEQIAALRTFGAAVGLAFQLVDDVLDGDGVAGIEGPEAAVAEAEALTATAAQALAGFGPEREPLLALARKMVERRT